MQINRVTLHFFMFLSLGGFVAQAQSTEPTFHYRDAYEVLLAEKFTFSRLEKLFNAGQQLDGHEFLGPKVGLAYYFNEPSLATSSAMIIEESTSTAEISVYESSYSDGRAFQQDDATINGQIFARLDLHDCYKTDSDNPLRISIIPDYCRRSMKNRPDYAIEYRTSGPFIIGALKQGRAASVELRQPSLPVVQISNGQIWGYSVFLAPLSY